MIQAVAPEAHQSRLFGVSNTAQAAMIMLKGYELGLGVTASFEFIQVIQGKPSLSPRGALALLHGNPLIEKIEINRMPVSGAPFRGYECIMQRRGGFAYRAQYTMEDAERAGLVKPGSGWASYPENMCLWRAVGFAADVVAPDLTAGMTGLMKMPEQYGVTLTQDGDVIEGQWTPAPAPTTTPASAQAEQQESAPAPTPTPIRQNGHITLEKLLEIYTAEQILVAAEGRLPGTDAEVAAVAAKLGGGAA